MRGNWNATNKRPSLKARLAHMREYNRRLAARDAANRCGTCKAALPAKPYVVWGDSRRFCSAICVPVSEHH